MVTAGRQAGRAPLWRTRRGRYGNGLVLAWLAACAVALLTRIAVPVPSWLLVHLFTLGAATTAILLWSEHFVVTWCRTAAPGAASLVGRVVGLTLAVVVVLVGVLGVSRIAALVGVGGVVAVGAWHGCVLWRLTRRATSPRFGFVGRFYLAACAALIVAVGLAGARVGGGVRAGVWVVLAHVHLAVLGWIGMTVLGTLVLLWPTVLRTRIVDAAERAGRAAWWPLVVGLVVLIGGLLAGQRFVAFAGLACYAAGTGISLVPFVRTARNRAPHGAAAWMMAAGVGWLLAALVYDAVLLLRGTPQAMLAHWGPLVRMLLAGFTAQVLAGALSYLLVPVLAGGPQQRRDVTGMLARAWVPRVVLANVAVLLVVIPAPAVVHTAGWAALILCYGGFVLLGLRVALVPLRLAGRRAGATGRRAAGQRR